MWERSVVTSSISILSFNISRTFFSQSSHVSSFPSVIPSTCMLCLRDMSYISDILSSNSGRQTISDIIEVDLVVIHFIHCYFKRGDFPLDISYILLKVIMPKFHALLKIINFLFQTFYSFHC